MIKLPETVSAVKRRENALHIPGEFLKRRGHIYRGSLLVRADVASVPHGFNALPESETLPPLPIGPPVIPLNRFEPYFDAMTPRNITALVGKSAYLTCRVRNLGNKTLVVVPTNSRHKVAEARQVGHQRAYPYRSTFLGAVLGGFSVVHVLFGTKIFTDPTPLPLPP
ncbi:hypothetical protein NQ317_019603 [Molorchus minor]|uniref:Uncharacterized protein n=1 Tax=Molorchus minor TaxID=1323400 RepID=A0ABQ9JD52_9CUCU|nr:hypothetical protein NQ317_019603 [Molorchus minor]